MRSRVQRVGARIAIVLRDVQPEFEILQAAEESEAAAPADPGAGKIAAPAWSALFSWIRLNARKRPIAACWPAAMIPMPASPRARRHRRGAEQQRQDHDPGRLLDAFVHPDDVAAGDVAELVGDHALHLIGVFGRR